jgi:hypothetical protein
MSNKDHRLRLTRGNVQAVSCVLVTTNPYLLPLFEYFQFPECDCFFEPVRRDGPHVVFRGRLRLMEKIYFFAEK